MNELTMGGFIAAKRQEKGMTQLELGEKLGVTDKAVSKWERDLSCPDIASIPKIADALGVSVEELMRVNGETAKTSENKLLNGETAKTSENKLSAALSLPFKAVALAMGVAVAALSVMKKIDTFSALTMLGIGLALLGIQSLFGEEE